MKGSKIFKPIKFAWLPLVAVVIAGCQNELLSESGDNDMSEEAEITFDLRTDDKANTRTIGIADVEGLSIVMVRAKNESYDDRITCTDGSYGTMMMRVPLGVYDVHAVASDAPDYVLEDDFIALPNGGNLWYAKSTLNVKDTGKEMIVPMELKRMNSKVVVTPLDEIPENCKNITITMRYGDDAMNTVGGAISQKKTLVKTVEIPESYKGTVGKLSISMYTILASVVGSVTLDVQAEDMEGNVVGRITGYTVTLKRNQQAYIKGYLFSSKANTGITIEYDWDDSIEYQW